MNRTTNEIFKFIHRNPVGLSLTSLYMQFPNKTAVDESYKILTKNNLITNRDGSIELTITGYDYYYNKRKSLIINILKTFVIPIAIAVISALFTARLISTTNECKCNITCNQTNENANFNP